MTVEFLGAVLISAVVTAIVAELLKYKKPGE